jgi:tryptophan-rich sensory protein
LYALELHTWGGLILYVIQLLVLAWFMTKFIQNSSPQGGLTYFIIIIVIQYVCSNIAVHPSSSNIVPRIVHSYIISTM